MSRAGTSKTATPQDLTRFVPLNSLGAENLKELSRKSRNMTVTAGRYLFRDGDQPSHQLFLTAGTVELIGAGGVEATLEAGSREASRSIDVASPQARAARAKTDVTALAVDRDLLDLMLTWNQTGAYHVEDLSDQRSEADEADWMTRLLQTQCFRHIPPANIQAIFMRLEPVSFSAGDEVIRQGDPGDYFYMVEKGRCAVTRATRVKPQGMRLAELTVGDSFGEEALISDKERNATVTMLTDGTLMRLSKEDFNALLNEPLLEWVDYEEAKGLVDQGAKWVDVRLPGEFEGGHIDGAVNIPLFFLRMKAQKLDPATAYIVYCDSGRRSSAASFLLSERGFSSVRVLRNGLARTPADAIVKEQRTSAD